MSEFSLASYNVKNLIGPQKEYYKFEAYTQEEHAWKEAWLADQLYTLAADIVCFQEIFEKPALDRVVAQADRRGEASNKGAIPDKSKDYAKKAIFRKLGYKPYGSDNLIFAPNHFDGPAGQRRPGLAVLSRFGFEDAPEITQVLDQPMTISFPKLGGGDAGSFTVDKLSRPIVKVKIKIKNQVVTVFNCHLKSKLGEFDRPDGADFASEADLPNYDAFGRALGEVRAMMRRTAEAAVLRRLVLDELKQDNPCFVLGDYNDSENSVAAAVIAGEKPFKNYSWMRRHDATHKNDRYTKDENKKIQAEIARLGLVSAEKLFVRKSLRDMVYTSAFGGVYESIDQILMSWHFHPDNPNRIGEMEYFNALNDHLTDGSHPEAPYNKLASDHGQIMARMRLRR